MDAAERITHEVRRKLASFLERDYRRQDRKEWLDKDWDGSDHQIVYAYYDDGDSAIDQANYELFMQKLGENNFFDYWERPNQRALWADMANEESFWKIVDLYADMENCSDLNPERSAELQYAIDIDYIESCKPTHLQENPVPENWASKVQSRVFDWGSKLEPDTIQEAAHALGFLTMLYCENGCVRYISTTDNHWSWYVYSDNSAAAHERYHTWLQTVTAQTISPVIEGFVRTFDPYPTQGENEYGEQIIDYIDGKHICPHCGAEMVEKQ